MCLAVVMDFSLDSLDGFPEDLETSREYILTKNTSSKACIKSKDEENDSVPNQECRNDTSAETKQREVETDNIESKAVFNEPGRVSESSKISLEKYHGTSSDSTKMKYEPSIYRHSTHETADSAISQDGPEHGRFDLKRASNCATPNSLSTSQREDLPKLATPTRGNNFVGVVSHHHDLSPWERWVVQKARQEQEEREGKRLSDAARREQEAKKAVREQQKKVIVQKRYEEWCSSKAALEREQKAQQQKKMAEKAAQDKEKREYIESRASSSFKEWQSTKHKLKKIEEQQRLQECRHKEEKQREQREKAEVAYQRWLRAAGRRKINSDYCCGRTDSPSYCNPHAWKGPLD